jgi:hypothetical protein
MRSRLPVLVAFLAITAQGALAQTAVSPALTVQRLAPQLVAFAGSQNNFQNLVTGLAQGTPIQLVTVLPDGVTQVVTFTPTAPMSPTDIAQVLETTRQQLIGLGIGNPSAEQIGIALMGGLVPTALGGSQVAGALNAPNAPSPAAQIQRGAAAGATAPATPAVTSGVNVQLLPNTLPATTTSATSAARNTSDSVFAAGATSRSPLPAPISTSPTPATPTPAPGAGSVPQAVERVPAGARPARN